MWSGYAEGSFEYGGVLVGVRPRSKRRTCAALDLALYPRWPRSVEKDVAAERESVIRSNVANRLVSKNGEPLATRDFRYRGLPGLPRKGNRRKT